MAFSSNTKSWQACNSAQQRECKALAVFTIFQRYQGGIEGQLKALKSNLLIDIKRLKETQLTNIPLTKNDLLLITAEQAIKNSDTDTNSIATLERLFGQLESHISLEGTPFLGAGELKSVLRAGELSKLFSAAAKFKWTGSNNKLPIGKSASEIGISDGLLDKLMDKSEPRALLSGWLISGDKQWQDAIRPEIERRKRELSYEKQQSKPNQFKVHQLESEIAKLEKDWRL